MSIKPIKRIKYNKYDRCEGEGNVDWTNPHDIRCLTEHILFRDYQINIKLHPNRLCPPIQNRLNYLIWLHSLFCVEERFLKSENVTVLDIGTGASSIYAILGAMRYNWLFVGSDIDDESLQWARDHVLHGNPTLQEKISLVRVEGCDNLQDLIAKQLIIPTSSAAASSSSSSSPSYRSSTRCLKSIPDILKDAVLTNGNDGNDNIKRERGPVRLALISSGHSVLVHELESEYYAAVRTTSPLLTSSSSMTTASIRPSSQLIGDASDQHVQAQNRHVLTAVMCNPPFYDLTEIIQTNEGRICTGQEGEMRTLGGEIAFVASIVADSLILKDRVVWYSSMLGFKSSVKPLLRILRDAGICNVRTTRFTQGRTMRWGIAWSLTNAGFSSITANDKLFGMKHKRSRNAASNSFGSLTLNCDSIRRTQLQTENGNANELPCRCVCGCNICMPAVLSRIRSTFDLLKPDAELLSVEFAKSARMRVATRRTGSLQPVSKKSRDNTEDVEGSRIQRPVQSSEQMCEDSAVLDGDNSNLESLSDTASDVSEIEADIAMSPRPKITVHGKVKIETIVSCPVESELEFDIEIYQSNDQDVKVSASELCCCAFDVKLTTEKAGQSLTSKSRQSLNLLMDTLRNEMLRDNRRWRRLLAGKTSKSSS